MEKRIKNQKKPLEPDFFGMLEIARITILNLVMDSVLNVFRFKYATSGLIIQNRPQESN
jgi:hypothetical protein